MSFCSNTIDYFVREKGVSHDVATCITAKNEDEAVKIFYKLKGISLVSWVRVDKYREESEENYDAIVKDEFGHAKYYRVTYKDETLHRFITYKRRIFESRYYTEDDLYKICKGLTVVVVRPTTEKGRGMSGILIDVGASEDYKELLKRYTNVGMNCRVAVLNMQRKKDKVESSVSDVTITDNCQKNTKIETLDDVVNIVGEEKFKVFVKQYLDERLFNRDVKTLGFQNK